MPPTTTTTAKTGFWGPPTSTLDWCEYNYEHTPYIAELWNTVTNLWMIIPPLYGIVDCLSQGFELRILLCYVSLLTVGLGSWLFHMTLTYEMQLLDEIPMVLAAAQIIYTINQVTKPPNKRNPLLIFTLLLYCLVFVVVYLYCNEPIFHEVIYGLLVFIMIMMDISMVRADRSSTNVKVFVSGTVMYLTGFFLWIVDNTFCSELRALRASPSMPSVLSPLTQLHGWWHFMAGYATYMQIVSVTNHRQRYLGRPCNYRLGVMGLQVQAADLKKQV